MSNNLVFRIADDLNNSIPSLHTLMLSNNSILNLTDLLPLANLPNLTRLVLIDNNVTKQPNYRLFVIKHLPQLMSLDFKKIKPSVRPPAPTNSHANGACERCAPHGAWSILWYAAGEKWHRPRGSLELVARRGPGIDEEDA